MSRPWTNHEALLIGHSQMRGMAPFLRRHLLATGARVVHTHAVRGLNVRSFRRQVRYGTRPIPRWLADEIPLVIVALSGNGVVDDPLELEANLDWFRAEYPRALVVWLGYTLTRTGTSDDEARNRAAELERRIAPRRDRFLWVDMRRPDISHAADGLHFSQAGYRELADHAWAAMLRGTETRRSFPWVALVLGAIVGVAGYAGLRLVSERSLEA